MFRRQSIGSQAKCSWYLRKHSLYTRTWRGRIKNLIQIWNLIPYFFHNVCHTVRATRDRAGKCFWFASQNLTGINFPFHLDVRLYSSTPVVKWRIPDTLKYKKRFPRTYAKILFHLFFFVEIFENFEFRKKFYNFPFKFLSLRFSKIFLNFHFLFLIF